MIISESALQNFLDLHGDRSPIVVTNGCFDLLHVGHIRLLSFCASYGQVLVLVNTDDSISKLKGPKRPIIPLAQRMEMLDAISYVDVVIPFSEDTPERLIKQIMPNYLVKGPDYVDKYVAGGLYADEILISGHEVDISTGKIVEACKQ